MGSSPRGRKESGTTEPLTLLTLTQRAVQERDSTGGSSYRAGVCRPPFWLQLCLRCPPVSLVSEGQCPHRAECAFLFISTRSPASCFENRPSPTKW